MSWCLFSSALPSCVRGRCALEVCCVVLSCPVLRCAALQCLRSCRSKSYQMLPACFLLPILAKEGHRRLPYLIDGLLSMQIQDEIWMRRRPRSSRPRKCLHDKELLLVRE
ncbi:uncharacterized protein B0J16DRAFT_160216 [Fusarium flagelliforme]|uniref:uncharacterized protein n=1 Tax=Fusarium flagelliforme TaxID=2675880 RepID=UPI001E8E5C36|nr:uncharacterized protein B0J16DRAFT_160216 [Fusarium flagelliforme]KAH7183033.1 hypothetical protein B0J16DRAFT_160216 [Fusarium flagelliforme]